MAAAGSRFNALAAEGKPEGGARAELLALLQLVLRLQLLKLKAPPVQLLLRLKQTTNCCS